MAPVSDRASLRALTSSAGLLRWHPFRFRGAPSSALDSIHRLAPAFGVRAHRQQVLRPRPLPLPSSTQVLVPPPPPALALGSGRCPPRAVVRVSPSFFIFPSLWHLLISGHGRRWVCPAWVCCVSCACRLFLIPVGRFALLCLGLALCSVCSPSSPPSDAATPVDGHADGHSQPPPAARPEPYFRRPLWGPSPRPLAVLHCPPLCAGPAQCVPFNSDLALL